MTAFDTDQPRLGRPWLGWLRTLGLSIAAACVAGRVLYPSEDAATGSGTVFLQLELFVGVFLAIDLWFDETRSDERVPFRAWLWLIAAIWISAMFASNRFAGKMMAWEWTGMGIVSLYFMQQSSRTGPRPMAMLVIALALAESFLALWQVGVEFPDLRRRFAENDPSVVAVMQETADQLGIDAAKLGERLLQSKEAHGTYGLANSLAGMLLVPFPILALLMFAPKKSAVPLHFWFAMLLRVLPYWFVFMALGMTKSRSAMLSSIFALATVPLAVWPFSRIWRRYGAILLGILILQTLLIVPNLLFGQVDRQDLLEAPKSLSYRLEWWQGSMGVSSESPLVGVGFGSFGSHYLRYKLPFSSEEVRDPHNFFVELACCGGLIVIAAYLCVLVASIRVAWPPFDDTRNASSDEGDRPVSQWFWGGAALALLILMTGRFGGGVSGFGWLAVMLGFTVVALLQKYGPIIEEDRLRRTCGIAVIGLHVNWLVAGGVSFPGVALPAWALLASAMVRKEPIKPKQLSRWGCVAGTVFFAALPVFYFGFFHEPLLRREQILSDVRSMNRRDADHILMMYRQAALATPGDPDGWLRLAEAHASGIRVGDEAFRRRHYREAQSAFRAAIRLDPRRSTLYRQLGLLEQEAAAQALDPSARENALAAFQAMIANYPNSAARRWEFGRFLWQIGDLEPARAEFRIALELDQTPHPDKKLSPQQRDFARGCLPK